MSPLHAEFAFLQSALNLREQRTQVLASNIANADTPNYKARDFDFSTQLRQNLSPDGLKPLPSVHLERTNARHIAAQARHDAAIDLKYRIPYQASLDGNTVEMDVERNAFAENALQQQSTIQLINQRMRAMQLAMQPN